LLKIKDKKPKKRLVMMTLENNKPGEPLLLHDEPIYLENTIIGRTTSGNYSFNYDKNLAFGYINSILKNDLQGKKIYVEIEKKKYPVEFLSEPLKDKRIKFS